jgi:YfiH family protein
MAWQRQEDNGISYYYSELLTRFPWLRQGFSARWPQLKVGSLEDNPEELAEKEAAYRRRFLTLFGLKADQTWLVTQVHGDAVLSVDGPPPPGTTRPEADALVTNGRGVGLATVHADCVPVVLVDPVRRIVGAVHAGWKGTLAGIVLKTLGVMTAKYGSIPADCFGAIGPAIGPCCYQVNQDRVDLFQKKWPQLDWEAARSNSTLDLSQINHDLLVEGGLEPTRIEQARSCTACQRADFYSFRREQTGLRMLSIVVMK